MVSLRFHLVSIVAAFLALGIGVLMGVTVVDQGVVNVQERQLDALQGRLDDRRQEIDRLDQQVSALSKQRDQILTYSATSAASALSPVVVIGLPGAENDSIKEVSSMLRDAGVAEVSVLRISRDWIASSSLSDRDLLVASVRPVGVAELGDESVPAFAMAAASALVEDSLVESDDDAYPFTHYFNNVVLVDSGSSEAGYLSEARKVVAGFATSGVVLVSFSVPNSEDSNAPEANPLASSLRVDRSSSVSLVPRVEPLVQYGLVEALALAQDGHSVDMGDTSDSVTTNLVEQGSA